MLYKGKRDQITEDFNRDFGGTYVYFNKVLSYMDRATDGFVFYSAFDGKQFTRKAPVPFTNFDITVPRSKIFQHGSRAYLFNRAVRRQFKRGICSSNSAFKGVSNDHVYSISEEVWAIREIFTDPIYTSVLNALENLHGVDQWEEKSYMISCDLVLGSDNNPSKLPVVYFLDTPVGLVRKQKVLLLGEYRFLIPKVEDYLEVDDVI